MVLVGVYFSITGS